MCETTASETRRYTLIEPGAADIHGRRVILIEYSGGEIEAESWQEAREMVDEDALRHVAGWGWYWPRKERANPQ